MRVTISIMVVCFSIFFMQMLLPWLTMLIALTPALAIDGMYWQFFTYMFAHASISHVGFNMIGLFIFGATVERFLGTRKYIYLYIISGVGSGIFHILITGISEIPMLGASGAVFAVLTAYAVKFPEARVLIFPLMIPVKAIYAIVGFVIFSIFAGLTNIMPGTAHFGHLGGILFGAGIMYYWKQQEKKRSDTGMDDFQFVWESW